MTQSLVFIYIKKITNFVIVLAIAAAITAGAIPVYAQNIKTSSRTISQSASVDYKQRANAKDLQFQGRKVAGEGTVIGIFDGGINLDSQYLKNGDSSRVISQACFGSSTEVSPCDTGANHQANIQCNTLDVGCFHGMSVAGFAGGNDATVKLKGTTVNVGGIATKASISYVRTAMDKSGSIQYSDFVSALNKFAEDVRNNAADAPDVINLSLSFPRDSYQNCEQDNSAKRLIDFLVSKGVVIVAATGNDSNKSEITYPACMSNVIAVSSSGFDGDTERVSGFSNMSDEVDIVAPGENQWGILPGQAKYAQVSGTSFAAPLVSGSVAILKQVNPSLSPADIKTILSESAEKVVDPVTGKSYPKLNTQGALNVLGAQNLADGPAQGSYLKISVKEPEVGKSVPSVSEDQTQRYRKYVVAKKLNEIDSTHPKGRSHSLLPITIIGLALALISMCISVLKMARNKKTIVDITDVRVISSSEVSDFQEWELDFVFDKGQESVHDPNFELVDNKVDKAQQ